MKKRLLAGILGVVCAAGVAASCNIVSVGDGEEEYIIKVDSLTVPASVKATDAMAVKVFGALPDGCHHYSRTESLVTASRVEVTVFGTVQTGSVACTQIYGIIAQTINAPPPHTNPVTVVIHQPDGSQTTRTVAVN